MLFDKQNTLELNFMGSKIKTVQSTKFLGVKLHISRKFDKHMDEIVIPTIRKYFSIFII